MKSIQLQFRIPLIPTCTVSNDLSLLVLKVSLMYSNRDLPEGRNNIITLTCQCSLDSVIIDATRLGAKTQTKGKS